MPLPPIMPGPAPCPIRTDLQDAQAPTQLAPTEPKPPAQPKAVPVKAEPTEPTQPGPHEAYHLPMMQFDGRTWYHFYGMGQPLRGAQEVDWKTFWFTYEAKKPSEPQPIDVDASDQPRPIQDPLPMSCFEEGRECVVRDARKAIMIHRLDYEQIRSQAAQGSISARFMLDTEAFSVFSGEYPFTNPPSTPEPAHDSAPGKNAADDGTVDNDTDLLGLLTDKGDAHEPRRPAPREPARGPFSFAALPTADRLPACPRLCIPEPPDRRYRGCTIVPSVCLPDTFRLAQEDTRLFYMDHNRRLRCAKPCSTQPFCPWGLYVPRTLMSPTPTGMPRIR